MKQDPVRSEAIFAHTNYRGFLKSVLADRAAKNKAYSLRAFSKALSISPGVLSMILKGGKNLSLERALTVARKIGLKEKETEYFLLLVQLDRIADPELRGTFFDRAAAIRPSGKVFDLSVDLFKVIADWHHLAILESLDVDGLEWSPKSIAKFLGISPIEVEAAIERLARLELIELLEGRKPTRTVSRLLVDSKIPSESIRKYYRQVLQKAVESIETQTPKEKVFATEVFAFDATALEEAKSITDRYLEDLLKLSRKSKNRRDLYQAAVQFFRININKGRE
ncbi:MAG: TIGR02147 family protein [Deltaproteobacteria bacterium]|nr:TIGR02147 family protein [Deltaproteobacteria bacterium]